MLWKDAGDFYEKVKKVHEFERVLLRFFSKICTAPKREYKSLFSQLQQDLFERQEKLVDENILDFLDFKAWIEERLR